MTDQMNHAEPTALAEQDADLDSGADTAPAKKAALHQRLWQGFRHFRRTRPFWGAIILGFGGYFVAQPLLGGSMAFYAAVGVRGMVPVLLGGSMIVAAAICMLLPAQRHFPSIIATMVSVASLPLANLGGWIIGMVLGIVGAGMCFAWAPYSDKQLAKFEAKAERKKMRREARRAGKQPAAA